MLSISIVNHGHHDHVIALLEDLARIAGKTPLEIILTNNIPAGAVTTLPDGLAGTVINNPSPVGFGHNHNKALAQAMGDIVCVLNPDIRLPYDPFPNLLAALHDPCVGLVAPAILSAQQQLEDSARRFPTPWSLLQRRLGGNDGRYRYARNDEPFAVDWVAGMFMLMRVETFYIINGFDQRYFLYCEDIDLCARLWRSGQSVILCPNAAAIHDARRDSHRKLKFLRWHVASYARYFATHWLRKIRPA
ncbi:glycosyltransferase family 2 protein [uncultured Sphingomonas sp.]|uniref:glycosyltransferase n=1 Tax=uncultured Sphingomonas sp. TaxID=158754 RepID=UPI002599F81D|nr:glycosyltransferase family 2 protein [uncultured Sphingomonas sp.]